MAGTTDAGALFACGRRTVTSWLRAAGLSEDYRSFYYFLQSVGLRWFDLGARVLTLVNEQVLDELSRVLLLISHFSVTESPRPFYSYCDNGEDADFSI